MAEIRGFLGGVVGEKCSDIKGDMYGAIIAALNGSAL